MHSTFSGRFASGSLNEQVVVDFPHLQGSGESSCKSIGADDE